MQVCSKYQKLNKKNLRKCFRSLLIPIALILSIMSGCGNSNEIDTTTSIVLENETSNLNSKNANTISNISEVPTSSKLDAPKDMPTEFTIAELEEYLIKHNVQEKKELIIIGKVSKIAEGQNKIYLETSKDYEILTYFYLRTNDITLKVGDNVKITGTIYKSANSNRYYFSDCILLEVNGNTLKDNDTSSEIESTTSNQETTSSKPSDTSSKPSETTSKPDNTSSKPSEITSKPDNTSSKPTETTSQPSSTNSNPFNTWDNPEQQQTTEYVLNTSTMKIHYPSCSYVAKIAPDNYATTKDYDWAISQGYQPCKKCH